VFFYCPKCHAYEDQRFYSGAPATFYDPIEMPETECLGCGAINAVDWRELRDALEY